MAVHEITCHQIVKEKCKLKYCYVKQLSAVVLKAERKNSSIVFLDTILLGLWLGDNVFVLWDILWDMFV